MPDGEGARHMIGMGDLRRQVNELPPLPDIAVKLLHMARDTSVAPRDFVEVIRYDAAITAKVLRLCNSAFYGLPRRVTSLQEAMVYLGVDALVNFVLAGCISGYFQEANRGYGLDPGELWKHSVGCAISSQLVAKRSLKDGSATPFTAGLLHDLGKIILNSFVAEDFRAALVLVQKYGLSFTEAEKKIVGFTHSEAGREVAEAWSLPEELVACIRYHHDPMAAQAHKELVACVHVGDILCLSLGIGVGIDGLAYEMSPGAIEMLHLRSEDLDQITIEFHEVFKETRESLLL